eukprot:TRINITY_DN18803_c0_g1_i1.p1 TRINITY_DN18803_c0_g1~~TRINITY_DN18803_c0_g1_i1.p1  ORF type:complete len:604 (-),score=117.91 TRINITY_DN18803_c0_g1_i1:349-2160(-)
MSQHSPAKGSFVLRSILILLLLAFVRSQPLDEQTLPDLADSNAAKSAAKAVTARKGPIPIDEPFECSPDMNEDCYFSKYSSPIWPEVRRNMSALTRRWQTIAEQRPPYPEGKYHGRGIAISCGPRGINNLPVLLRVLRDMGCNLPVEIWYLSSENLPFEHAGWLAMYKNVTLKDVLQYAKDIEMVETNVGPRMFAIKPLVLLHSSFEEVLLLDDDNLPLRDPTYLFEYPQYRKSGAIFWPDYWRTSPLNPIWELVGAEPNGYEQESGQLLVNKRKGWAALAVTLLFNQAPYRLLLNGDKDTYRFAWMAVKQPASFVQQAIGTAGMVDSKKDLCGTTMVQFDLDGHEIFLHHNMLKSGPLKRAGANWAEAKIPVMGPMEQFKPVPGDALELADETSINCMDISGRYDVKLRPFKEFEEKYFDSHEELAEPWLLTNSTERFKIPIPEESVLAAIKGVNLKGTVSHGLSFPTPNTTRLKIEVIITQVIENGETDDDPRCESKVWVDQVLLPLGRCPTIGAGFVGTTLMMHNKSYYKLQARDTGQGKCSQVFELAAQPFTGVITKKAIKVRLCGWIKSVNGVRCSNTSVKLHMPRCRGKHMPQGLVR